MEDLYRRLPRLLKSRTEWSSDSKRAYPTTIRLTVRSVVERAEGDIRRRPFETRSQQMLFDGRTLINEKVNGQEAAALLRQFVTPLLQSLLLSSGDINVTKLNVGLTNFQDIPVSPRPNAHYTTHTGTALQCRTSAVAEPTTFNVTVTARNSGSAITEKCDSDSRQAARSSAVAINRILSSDKLSKGAKGSIEPSKSATCSKRRAASSLNAANIDPSVLGELPPDIAAEVLNGLHCVKPPRRKRRIDQFFAPK
jgi:hypothetical protein